MSDHFTPEAASYTTHYKKHKRLTSIPSVGFELQIAALEQAQTCSLDCKAIGIGQKNKLRKI